MASLSSPVGELWLQQETLSQTLRWRVIRENSDANLWPLHITSMYAHLHRHVYTSAKWTMEGHDWASQGKRGEGALTVYSHLGLQVLSLPGVSETISFKDERREEGGRKGGTSRRREGQSAQRRGSWVQSSPRLARWPGETGVLVTVVRCRCLLSQTHTWHTDQRSSHPWDPEADDIHQNWAGVTVEAALAGGWVREFK